MNLTYSINDTKNWSTIKYIKKALDRRVETLGLWIVTSSVTFIKSVNQSSIKPCLIDQPCHRRPNKLFCAVIRLLVHKWAGSWVRDYLSNMADRLRYQYFVNSVCTDAKFCRNSREYISLPTVAFESEEVWTIHTVYRDRQATDRSPTDCRLSAVCHRPKGLLKTVSRQLPDCRPTGFFRELFLTITPTTVLLRTTLTRTIRLKFHRVYVHEHKHVLGQTQSHFSPSN